jgi:nicotinamidase/pyrazinamidase
MGHPLYTILTFNKSKEGGMRWGVFAIMAMVFTCCSLPVSFVFAQEKIAAIVVDMQGDFTTARKGALAVSDTDEQYVKKVSDNTIRLKEQGVAIYGTQDWHPASHISFAANHPGKKPFEAVQIDGRTQVLWPSHCVQGTDGAKVLLDNNLFQAIVKKGQNPKFDSYSGFQDDGGAKTEMDNILKAAGIQKLIIYGLATDYCVKATAIDAAANGYKVIVIENLSKGVAPDTTAKALNEMKAKGILILREIDMEQIKAV